MPQHSAAPPLILTLALDAVSFGIFDRLRKQHFPPERNFLPAHLTLFHALPGEEEAASVETLNEVCASQAPIELTVKDLRLFGRGVAYEIESSELQSLRRKLAERWRGWLSPQDQQKFQPHVTIQNKVAPENARALFRQLAEEFTSWQVCGDGCVLWRYLNGPWELVREIHFGKCW